jgi:O-antigen ligase
LFEHYYCNFKKIFLILFTIITFVTVVFFAILLKDFILNENVFYFYGNKELLAESNNTFFMQTNPRVTGLGRNLVIILCVLIFIYNDLIVNKSLVFKIIFLFLVFLSVFLMWGTQSRGAFLCFALLVFIFLFFDNKKNLKYKVLFSIIIFTVPILLFENISELKYENYKKKYKLDDNSFKNSRIINPKNLSQNETGHDYSTGRTIIWKRSLNLIYQKPWVGYGPQGDRIALSSDKEKTQAEEHIWDNNSSNAIIYTLLSSGIFGLCSLIGIYLLLVKKIINLIFKYSVFYSSNYWLKISISIIAILLVRSIFENGFAFFGIDLIFLITCYYYLKNNYSKLKIMI